MPLPIQDTEMPNEMGNDNKTVVVEKEQPATNNLDEYAFLLQNLKEQVKVEIKDEIYKSISLKANSLMSIDPSTATSLMAVAAAITGAVSQVTPVDMSQAQPSEEPAAPPSQQSQQSASPVPAAPPVKSQVGQPVGKSGGSSASNSKPSSSKPPSGNNTKPPATKTAEFIFDTTIEYLKRKNYFELNKEAGLELEDDLTNTIEYINHGANVYAYNNDLDFTDTNTWDLLKELIDDGTLYRTGYNDLVN